MPLLGRLRLRHKLAISLSLAALLPVALAATVAVRIVLGTLEEGIRAQTARQLHIAMNLVLRHVERLGTEAARLASAPDLIQALDGAQGDVPPAVAEVLGRESPQLPSALVQVTDARGRIVAARAVGGNFERFRDVAVTEGTPAIASGLAYERRVTLLSAGDVLVVRAVAPVVDPGFDLHGVVVLSLPLDGDFADGIKGALGVDVLLHAGARPAMSSFLDALGGRATGIAPPPGVTVDVLAGRTRLARATIHGREYELGYAPLKSLDGEHVGMLGVAVGRESLAAAKRAAAQSLALGAAGAVAFALLLAAALSRRFTRPIARLHAGALAVARGDLDVRLAPVQAGDEIGDLAAAFATMTASLRENQARLAARMREIVALHEAGRAVSSVLGLEEVLRKIVDSVAGVLDARLAALWLVEPRVLRIGAARANPDVSASKRPTLRGEDAEKLVQPLGEIARQVADAPGPARVHRLDGHPEWRPVAEAAHVSGSLLAVPLERKGTVLGVLVIGRDVTAPSFSEADENLIGTFAGQAATAIENARLYEEVRAFSEELEKKVQLRTSELTAINQELGRALSELRETQSQLVLSERMAGLGALVAGVAHEINSPSAAIRGSVDALAENVKRLAARARQLGELGMDEDARRSVFTLVEEIAPRLADIRVASPAEVRRRARALAQRLAALGVAGAEPAARTLAEIGADELIDPILPVLLRHPIEPLVGYLAEYAYLHRNAAAIQTAIKQIQRIVGALKSYSHLDQAKIETADIHEGIENTLVILHHELKYGIRITRRYAKLPPIPVYVDELNQVWTNLIHNAVQALGGKGEIIIETSTSEAGDSILVRVIDNGPGIPDEIKDRIFEPFFTTKAKGEGTGLGLGIVKRIVEKHRGEVQVESVPGRTCFTVRLPISGPAAARVVAS